MENAKENEKIKTKREKPGEKLKEHGCGCIRASLLLQERWALIIVYHLQEGPLGFNELGRRLSCVNPTTLSQRLDLLEEANIILRTVHSTMPPKTSYELTAAGKALRPILQALGEWGEKHLPAMPCPPDNHRENELP